jgi:hypothetical protein
MHVAGRTRVPSTRRAHMNGLGRHPHTNTPGLGAHTHVTTRDSVHTHARSCARHATAAALATGHTHTAALSSCIVRRGTRLHTRRDTHECTRTPTARPRRTGAASLSHQMRATVCGRIRAPAPDTCRTHARAGTVLQSTARTHHTPHHMYLLVIGARSTARTRGVPRSFANRTKQQRCVPPSV